MRYLCTICSLIDIIFLISISASGRIQIQLRYSISVYILMKMMIQTRKMMIGLHIPSLGLHIPSHIDRSLRELAAPASPQHRERGLLRDSILLYFLE